ncbi:MAG: anti-sigma factor antagonist [Oscillospiraceae bacterium]|nr:anti-sigma factor antagonist [Oscillospiraceae bacterium]
MPVMIDNAENTVTARITGEIDHHNAAELRGGIDLAIKLHQPEKIILDFGGVTFMDSSGIGLVMGRHKAAASYGGKLTVTNTSPDIKKVMRLAGLERLADIN